MRMPRLWVVVGLVGSFAGARTAHAQEAVTACEPACSEGQTCVDGVCMVPAAAPAAAAPAAGYPYAAPPSYPYPPSPPQPPLRPPRTGLLVLPYIGINSIHGDGTDPDTGFRVGSMFGGRVNDLFSANGEVTFDLVNVDAPAGVDVWEYIVQLAFSPLFHFATPGADFVLGPKAGGWAGFAHISGYGESVDITARGWLVGFNAGAFFPVNPSTSLGVLLSYVSLQTTQACVDQGGTYGEQCQDSNGDVNILGLHFAALF
jgi:hypothetical protein